MPEPRRSEGRRPCKAAPTEAPDSSKPPAGGPAPRRPASGSSSVVRGRSAGSAAASPLLPVGVQRSDNVFQLPPLVLPVPPRRLVPAWPAQQAAAQQGPAQPAQLLPLGGLGQMAQAQQAQQADEWLFGQPLTADDLSRVEQEAAAAQLSPADVDCLMSVAAGAGSLPPPAQQPQCTEGSRGSHVTQLAPAPVGAPPLPVQSLLQQPQQVGCNDEISPDMWESLLGDSGGEPLAAVQ